MSEIAENSFASDLLFQLSAPYNAPIMEVWIAALIGRYVVGRDEPWKGPMVYDVFDGTPSAVGGRPTTILRPTSDDHDAWNRWIAAVESHFLSHHECGVSSSILSEAFTEELKGKRSRGRSDSARRRNIVAAIPLVPSSAALQNQVGIVGSTQYNDYGLVVEQAFAFGRPSGAAKTSAGDQLLTSMKRIMGADERLAHLNSAISDGILNRIDPTVQLVGENLWMANQAVNSLPYDSLNTKVIAALGESTPFHWFHRSWNLLSDEKWIEALPPRRWVDWSIAIIRLGIGMGLLWTNRWYEEIARLVVDSTISIESDDEILEYLSDQMRNVDLLRWPESTESYSNRNVKPQFDQSFRRGMNSSLIILDKSRRVERETSTLSQYLQNSRNDIQVVSRLQDVLASSVEGNRTVKNLRYTAMDLLAARNSGNGVDDLESADHYSLLRHGGRGSGETLLFEPTTEVIAVIASLACATPSSSATLGEVSRELESLGLRPSISELRKHLERAGLSRAVADASLQIEVNSAFVGRS